MVYVTINDRTDSEAILKSKTKRPGGNLGHYQSDWN